MSRLNIIIASLIVGVVLCGWGIYRARPAYGALEQSMAYGAASSAVAKEIRMRYDKAENVDIEVFDHSLVESKPFKRFRVSGEAYFHGTSALFSFRWTAVVRMRSGGDYIVEGLLVDREYKAHDQ